MTSAATAAGGYPQFQQPRKIGTTGNLFQGSLAEPCIHDDGTTLPTDHHNTSPSRPNSSSSSSSSSCSPSPRSRPHAQSNIHPPSNIFFKSAQWSPDGTAILTSSCPPDHTLRSYILPADLLLPPHPRTLVPYALHRTPEPVHATAFHPSFDLADPSTCLALASPRSLPIRLFSPFAADRILASYPLVRPSTETWVAPHALLFDPRGSNGNGNCFFAGSESCVSVFDVGRDGDGPVARMPTTGHGHGHGQGFKGIVSALGMSCGGVLAAGTYTRWVGLYDGSGRGGASAGVFTVEEGDDRETERDGGGGGITQVVWSPCGRYLCVAERLSDGAGVWDIRGTGRRLAWLRGRNATTQQRLGVEVMGSEVWAGGLDGRVRVWEGLGTREGSVDPSWRFAAHDDAVASTALHPSGSVLATCSGQRRGGLLLPPTRGTEDGGDGDSDGDSSSPDSLGGAMSSPSFINVSSWRAPRAKDNSLTLWAL